MKRSINKVALVLWIIAVLFVFGGIWTTVDMYRSVTKIYGNGDNVYLVGESLARTVQSTIGIVALLTATGVLIELVDQIRWTIVRAVENGKEHRSPY